MESIHNFENDRSIYNLFPVSALPEAHLGAGGSKPRPDGGHGEYQLSFLFSNLEQAILYWHRSQGLIDLPIIWKAYISLKVTGSIYFLFQLCLRRRPSLA